MPFEPGNKLAKGGRKDKPFRDALRMQVAAAGDDQKILREIADSLLIKALCGDLQAIRELADRLDGKVPQAIVGDDEHDPIRLGRIERVIVDPRNPDGAGVPAAADPGTI